MLPPHLGMGLERPVAGRTRFIVKVPHATQFGGFARSIVDGCDNLTQASNFPPSASAIEASPGAAVTKSGGVRLGA